MPNPRYHQSERVSPREKRTQEYLALQDVQQRQQALTSQRQGDLVSQLAQMYGLSQEAEMSPLRQQALSDAHARSQYDLTRAQQFDPAQLAALQAETEARKFQNQWAQPNAELAHATGQANLDRIPLQNQALEAQVEAQRFQNQWAQPNAEQQYAAGQGAMDTAAAQRDILRQQAEWYPKQQAQELARGEFDLNRMGPLKLRLGESQISGQNAQNASSMYDRGLLAPRQAQEVGMPDYYKSTLAPVYAKQAADQAAIAAAEFGGKPMDDTTKAALLAKYGPEWMKSLPAPPLPTTTTPVRRAGGLAQAFASPEKLARIAQQRALEDAAAKRRGEMLRKMLGDFFLGTAIQ